MKTKTLIRACTLIAVGIGVAGIGSAAMAPKAHPAPQVKAHQPAAAAAKAHNNAKPAVKSVVKPRHRRLLPDLVVEKIWLEKGHVALRLKNTGRGSIPADQYRRAKVKVGTRTYSLAVIDPRGLLKQPGRSVAFTTAVAPPSGPKTRRTSITVYVDCTRKIHEQNEGNNTRTVRLAVPARMRAAKAPPAAARTAGSTKSAGRHPASPHVLSSMPAISVEKIFLQHGTIHVQLKNTGRANLTSAQLRSARLHLFAGTKAHAWHLADIDRGRHLLHPRGSFDFDTGIRAAAGANVRTRLAGVRGQSLRTSRLAPALQFKERSRAPATKGKPATRDLRMSRVGPLQRAPGTGPAGDLQVGPPYNLKPAPKKPQWNVQFQTPPPEYPNWQVWRPRDAFGENNDTFGNAYRLMNLNQTYRAACHGREDEDYYKFTLPASGAGSWVQITVRSIDPASHKCELDLMGPDQAGWEETGWTTNGRLWVAGVPGLTLYIHVKSEYNTWGEDQPDAACVLDYNLTLQSQVIPDAAASVADDDNGFNHASISINPGEGKGPFYMAQVGDADHHTRKSWDVFKFTWQACRHYCVSITRGGEIAICNGHGCTGGGENEPVKRACTGTCEENSHQAYIGIKATGDEDGSTWPFHGTGPLPARYTQPYTVMLIDAGDCRSFDDLGSCPGD